MKFKLVTSLALSIALCLTWACELDTSRAISAGMTLISAAAVSDGQLKEESRNMRAVGDREAKVAAANSNYVKRLDRLTGSLGKDLGLDLNFKVYLTDEINANATPDGSIRVYSGLMDYMNDEELFFVIGHEIGHVVNGDALDAMRVAYTSAGLRQGAASMSGAAASLTDSVLGDLLETAINAQFSQKQESEADEYGYNLMKVYGKNPASAVSALNKLAALGSGGGFLSSHPDGARRAKNIEKMISDEGKR
ncbi:MAG: M48 family metalloprotease [Desulfovibrionaceae bacterium]|nr:M48 family metalloprotease [Desulfovibrionaceae bacterium]